MMGAYTLYKAGSPPPPIPPLAAPTDNASYCCNCDRSIFGTILQPDGSGVLPQQEGIVEFRQVFITPANKLAPLSIAAPTGYFLSISGISVNPPGSNASLWAYPINFNLANANPEVSSPIAGVDPGYELIAGNNANGFALNAFTVGPLLKLVPRSETGVGQNVAIVIRAIQLRDCPNNWNIR